MSKYVGRFYSNTNYFRNEDEVKQFFNVMRDFGCTIQEIIKKLDAMKG